MMLLFPTISAEGNATFILSRFGATGMFLAIISGLFVACVMNFAAKRSFFDETHRSLISWWVGLIAYCQLHLS